MTTRGVTARQAEIIALYEQGESPTRIYRQVGGRKSDVLRFIRERLAVRTEPSKGPLRRRFSYVVTTFWDCGDPEETERSITITSNRRLSRAEILGVARDKLGADPSQTTGSGGNPGSCEYLRTEITRAVYDSTRE